MNDAINIAVTIDRNYLQPAGVMLNSLLQNTKSAISIYLLHPDLTDADKEKLCAVVSKYEFAQIEYIQVSNDRFSGLKVIGHFSPVMYYKLCFESLLPDVVERLVYLDPDVLVLTDIEELWMFDLQDAVFAAVPLHVPVDREGIVKAGEPYFSCGVMLVNMKKWHQEKLDSLLMDAAVSLSMHYNVAPEMEILNAVTKNKWIPLPVFWNWWPLMSKVKSLCSREDIARIKNNQGIVHFPAAVKPWHYACSHPKRNLYIDYRKHTPWDNTPLDGKSFAAFVARNLPYRLNHYLMQKLGGGGMASILKKLLIEDSN